MPVLTRRLHTYAVVAMPSAGVRLAAFAITLRRARLHGGKSVSAHVLPPPPRVGVIRSPAIAAYTGIAGSRYTDRADRTRGEESLRPISGFAVPRRAPNGRRPRARPRQRGPPETHLQKTGTTHHDSSLAIAATHASGATADTAKPLGRRRALDAGHGKVSCCLRASGDAECKERRTPGTQRAALTISFHREHLVPEKNRSAGSLEAEVRLS
jgi:hypothetical protein